MQKKMSVFMRRSTLLRLYRGPLLFSMAFVSWPGRENETISVPWPVRLTAPQALITGASSKREAPSSQLPQGRCWEQPEEPRTTARGYLWSIPCVPDPEGQWQSYKGTVMGWWWLRQMTQLLAKIHKETNKIIAIINKSHEIKSNQGAKK